MKTLILYASKHGATREIAERIAKRVEHPALFDLSGGEPPAPGGYDVVIIGSPVYAGAVRGEAKAYVARHADALGGKPLGLFLSGMSGDDPMSFFSANYPKEVVARAKAKAMLGGIFDPAKAGFAGRLIMRAVARKTAYENTISDEKIKAFAEALQA